MKWTDAPWVNFVALILVNLLWAIQYPAYKIAGDRMESAALNFWTLVFASLLLTPLWMRGTASETAVKFQWQAVRKFVVLAILGILPPSVMLSWGIARSSASNASILSLTIPVLMTAMGVLMLREKLTATRLLSLCLGLVGTLLISTNDLAQASFEKRLLIGNLVILLAGLGSAFYNSYSKSLLSSYSELQVLWYSYAIATVACAAISAGFDSKPFYRVGGYGYATWGAVVALGFLSWGIAMVLWMWVLKRLEVGQVSTSIYLLPLFGLILSTLTLHEHITTSQVLGGGLTVAATAILTLYDRTAPTVSKSNAQ